MSDRDDSLATALAVSGAAAALVVAGVLALAVSSASHQLQAAVAAVTLSDEGAGTVERIGFEPGSAALQPEAAEALQRAASALQADGALTALVLPFYAEDASPVANTLAESEAAARGLAVRHALEANGVPPQRIMLAHPEPAPDDDAENSAPGVEVRLL